MYCISIVFYSYLIYEHLTHLKHFFPSPNYFYVSYIPSILSYYILSYLFYSILFEQGQWEALLRLYGPISNLSTSSTSSCDMNDTSVSGGIGSSSSDSSNSSSSGSVSGGSSSTDAMDVDGDDVVILEHGHGQGLIEIKLSSSSNVSSSSSGGGPTKNADTPFWQWSLEPCKTCKEEVERKVEESKVNYKSVVCDVIIVYLFEDEGKEEEEKVIEISTEKSVEKSDESKEKKRSLEEMGGDGDYSVVLSACDSVSVLPSTCTTTTSNSSSSGRPIRNRSTRANKNNIIKITISSTDTIGEVKLKIMEKVGDDIAVGMCGHTLKYNGQILTESEGQETVYDYRVKKSENLLLHISGGSDDSKNNEGKDFSFLSKSKAPEVGFKGGFLSSSSASSSSSSSTLSSFSSSSLI